MVTVGIIGAGRIGKVHTESICNYVRNARLKTVADPFLNETTENWLKSMGVENTTKDYHDILNDPEIDAVLICSSTNTHSPISLEAIAAPEAEPTPEVQGHLLSSWYLFSPPPALSLQITYTFPRKVSSDVGGLRGSVAVFPFSFSWWSRQHLAPTQT